MSLPLDSADLPAGFRLYGLRCGISAVPDKLDLALFYSDRPARAAGLFTQNLVKAAPVKLCQAKFAEGPAARAVVINSGCANACTGKSGDQDAAWTARTLAGRLGCPASEILVASTGVIGRPLPRQALNAGLAGVAARVTGNEDPRAEDAVRAIMTTDTRPKAARAVFASALGEAVVWGCAKGAGMIHPDMATMLAVILTDGGLPPAALRRGLAKTADRTFNCVSVDGDTSTNDSLFLLDNGTPRAYSPKALAGFEAALEEVCWSLARQIAADGEGATRTATITVEGAPTDAAAKKLAATVATSALVKTALHGADPNWGRILAALGRAGVAFNPSKANVKIGGILVCKNGGRAPHSENAVHNALSRPEVAVEIALRQGPGRGRYVTCDYSREYIAINADYTT